jgi:hypothetical protein
VFSKIKNKFFFVIILYLGTHYCYWANPYGNSHRSVS